MKKKRSKRIRYFVEVKDHFWVYKLKRWVSDQEQPINFEEGYSTHRVFRTINAALNHLNYLYTQGYKYKLERFSRHKGIRRIQTWANY